MIKKMINKKSHPRSLAIKRNLFYTPLSTRYTTHLSEKSTKPENTKTSLFYPQNKGLITSITEYSQSFMKLAHDFIKENNNIKNNITTFESMNDLTSINDGEENMNGNCLTTSKKVSNLSKKMEGWKEKTILNIQSENGRSTKDNQAEVNESFLSRERVNSVNKKKNQSQQIIKLNELNTDTNRWFNLLRKNEFEDEFNFKIQKYDTVVKLLQEELRRLKKNQSLSPNRKSINIKIQREPTATKYPNRSNSMAYRSDLSNSNMNYSISSRSIQLPFLKANSASIDFSFNGKSLIGKNIKISQGQAREVETITNNLYTQIFTDIFDEISVVPNFIDRNYIKFNNINLMTLCFLKPLFETLFKCNLSITKSKFIELCFLIFNNLSIFEKKKFIITCKMNNNVNSNVHKSQIYKTNF